MTFFSLGRSPPAARRRAGRGRHRTRPQGVRRSWSRPATRAAGRARPRIRPAGRGARDQPLPGPGLAGRQPVDRTLQGRLVVTGSLAPPRSSSSARRRPPAASPRPPSARTPAGPTPGRSAAWLDGPAARGRHPGRVPRRAPRPGPGAGERGDGGGRGVLPGPPRRRPDLGRETDGPGPRWLPADGRQSRTGAGATVRGGGPRRRPRHLPPAPLARPRPRVRGGRPRARPPRRRDRRAPLHGGMRRSEVSASPARSGRCGPRRARRPRTASCRSRRRWWAAGSRRRPAPPGVEHVTAHSGRVGLASQLTSRGASTTDVMLAGNWKTSRMIAHYSAGATAERGAVARYLLAAATGSRPPWTFLGGLQRSRGAPNGITSPPRSAAGSDRSGPIRRPRSGHASRWIHGTRGRRTRDRAGCRRG